MRLGKNWYAQQLGPDGKPFRWVDNDATVLLSLFCRPYAMLLEIEPGPGMDGKPCQLTISDAAGRALDEQTLDCRTRFFVALPPDLGPRAELRIHAAGGGKQVGADPRILNFRVFQARLTAHEVRTDVVDRRLKLGPNWFPVETQAGQLFRWVDNDAALIVRPWAEAARVLEIDAEPGPSLGGQPCRLQVLDDAGSELAARVLAGRETVRFDLPPVAPGQRLRLRVPPVGVPVPYGETRLLHFRVFGCRLVDRDSE
jgi:hypothetical protein